MSDAAYPVLAPKDAKGEHWGYYCFSGGGDPRGT